MNLDLTSWIATCKKMGGNIVKQEKSLICDFDRGKLGVKIDHDREQVKIIDNRMKPGKNIVQLEMLDDIDVDGGMQFKAGQSKINIDKKDSLLHVYTEIEGEPLYGRYEEAIAAVDLDYSRLEKAGCPIGSREDEKTGSCIPDVKLKPQVPSSKVPLPKYQNPSVHWNKSADVPWILIDDSYSMAKANIGTWINSGHAKISKEFLACKKPIDITVEVGKEYKIGPGEGLDKSVKIGQTKYHRDRIYEIAEEIFGVPIMDTRTNKPMSSELGKRIHLEGLITGEHDVPLVIRGKNKVYYLLNPMEEW